MNQAVCRPGATRRVDTSAGAWWTLWAVVLSLSWLLPAFSPPWPSFDLELLAAGAGLALSAGLLWVQRDAWSLPTAAIVTAAIAVIPIAQHAVGMVLFFGDAWMSALYVVGFAASMIVGAQAARHSGWQCAIFLSFGCAAVLSVGIQLKQWLGVEGLYGWTRDMPYGDRPFANLGQPNNLATLVCWGLIGAWWAFHVRAIRGRVALAATAYLLLGLALTKSRAGWVMVALLTVSCFVFELQLGARAYRRWVIGLALLFVLYVVMMDTVGLAIDVGASNPLSSRLLAGYRGVHWHHLMHAVSVKPWLGWGWNQVSVAQQAVAPDLPPVPELLGYSHDLVLDLIVWNGLPIGGIISIGLAIWLWRTARRTNSENVHLYLCLLAFIVHCLVEYPHAYEYFLLPCGLIAGTLTSTSWPPPRFSIDGRMMAGLTAVLSGLVVWTAIDYYQARDSFTALRFEKARIGRPRDTAPPRLMLLTQLGALATMDRMTIRQGTSDADAEISRKTAERYPAERILMQYAAISAGRSETEAAKRSLIKVCKLYPPDRCAFAEQVWTYWGDNQFPWIKVAPFPTASNMKAR